MSASTYEYTALLMVLRTRLANLDLRGNQLSKMSNLDQLPAINHLDLSKIPTIAIC